MKTALTERQVAVVRGIARGLSYDDIGSELGITGRTVKAHVETMFRKLGVGRRQDIPAAYWKQSGVNPYPTALAEALALVDSIEAVL